MWGRSRKSTSPSSSRTDSCSALRADASPPPRRIATSGSILRVQARALSSRLFFRSQPLGTVLIDSPLPPAVVLDNLRARGRQWRESTVPDDLRKLGIINLEVDTRGAQFE